MFKARPPSPRAAAPRLRTLLVLAAGLVLAGCANENVLPFSTTAVPDVPKVDPNAFPTFNTAAPAGRPPLTPAAQGQLQKDLESLGKSSEKKTESRIESGT